MSDITPFSNSEFHLDMIPDGDSFNVGAPGLAKSLGFRDAPAMMRSVPDAEKGYTSRCTPGGEQQINYVTEAGFYRVIGQRQSARVKDDAIRAQVERFQHWFYGDVLPTIRRTGGYAAPAPALSEEEVVHQALQITYRKVQELEAKAAEDAPKVAYHDDFVCTEDLLRFATVASTLGITEKRLRELLAEHGWIFKEEATRRSQKTGEKKTVYRYSEYADKKRYFQRQEVHDAPRFRGEVMHTLKITPDGATAIVRAVKRWTAVGETPEIEGVPVEDAAPGDLPAA